MAQRPDAGGNVPKFGSFKARQSNSKTDAQNDKRETPSKRSGRSDEWTFSDKRSSPGSHARSRSKKPLIESDHFFVDVRGDPGNIQYGGLHRGDIPRYHRIGSGSVIGAPSHVRIDKSLSTDQIVVFYNAAPDSTRCKAIQRVKTGPGLSDVMETSRASSLAMKTQAGQDFVRLKVPTDPSSTKVGDGIWHFIEKGSDSEAESESR